MTPRAKTPAAILCALLGALISHECVAQEDDRRREPRFGDWGGLRTRLAEHGATLELAYTAEYLRNVRGGPRRGGAYRADLSLRLELDTGRAGWWDNGEFFLHLQAQHGDGITDRITGDFQRLSNIDADDFAQVSEVWYRHRFLDGKLWLKLGKQDANADFAFADYGGEFINSSPGFSPTIPLVTFPDPDWGFVLGIEPSQRFSLNLGLYQGRPDGGRSIADTLDTLRGPMIMVEPAFHYHWRGLPGHLRLGFWWNGDRFDKIAPEEAESRPYHARTGRMLLESVRAEGLLRAYLAGLTGALGDALAQRITERILGLDGSANDTHGFYAAWDQLVWKEHARDPDDEQGLGLFAQFGASDGDYLLAKRYYGLGLQWTGPIPGRDDEIFGLGVFHVDFSEKAALDKPSETIIELYYKARLAPWLTLKPNLHYLIHPGGADLSSAFALGFRAEFFF